MKYLFIVTWYVISQVPAPCPDANQKDEFGVGSSYRVSCAVYHTQSETTYHKKEFYNKDSAKAFILRASKRSVNDLDFTMQPKITNIKLDSIIN
jgi:hypothetical protein